MSAGLKYQRKRPIPKQKIETVEKLKKLLNEYDTIILIDFEDLPANMMKDIRKKFWGKAEIVIAKNTLARLAIRDVAKKKKNLEKLLDHLQRMRAFVFTNENIFEIARELSSIREKLPPKPGKISPVDIIIPRMNTGYRTGPIMTDFRLAGLPIKMIEGEIWIWEETHFVKKGQKLTPQAAKILSLLDLSPFEVGPKVIVGYDHGEVISSEILLKPLEEYEEMVSKAFSHAYNLVMNLAIPVAEYVPQQLQLAIMRAINVAAEANIITDLTAEIILSKAFNLGLNIAKEVINVDPNALPESVKELLSKAPVATTEPKEEKKEETPKEEKKEEEKEEDAVSGLASLFG